MDNTKVISHIERARLDDAEFQRWVDAYRRLSDDERDLLDAIIFEFAENMHFCRLGVAGSFEVIVRVGQFMADPGRFSHVE
jgi:hypothetical protein